MAVDGRSAQGWLTSIPDGERTISLSEATKRDFAQKTYRYLRIALVAMIVAIIVSIAIEWRRDGGLLSAMSSYYYTPAQTVFVGGLVMIGVCLIAIHGNSRPEEIALNVAGMLVPIVALVPTGPPSRLAAERGDLKIFDEHLSMFESNGVLAVCVGLMFALVVAAWMGRSELRLGSFASHVKDHGWAYGVAVSVVVVLLLVWQLGDVGAVHTTSAVGAVAALGVVAMLNAVRHQEPKKVDGDAVYQWQPQVLIGIAGSVLVAGVAMAVVGVARLVAGKGFVWFVVALVLLGLIGPNKTARTRAAKFFQPPDSPSRTYDRLYVAVTAFMIFAAPVIGLWPTDGFATRTFWVEILELVPFGAFWLIQTFEYWSPEVEAHASAA